MDSVGPSIPIAKEIFQMKYAGEGESFRGAATRVANKLQDSPSHFEAFRDILLGQYFLPGGRIMSACGSPRNATMFNCFVMRTIPDSIKGIMEIANEAALTMQMGGGVGYDFSTIRPRGTLIKSLDSKASGPVSFMGIYDAVCRTIASAGHRRGAQMACLRVDHPDIEEFIHAKNNTSNFTQFNTSVLVTDEFMEAVEEGRGFDLQFDGRVYRTVDARNLWDSILRSTWHWAEPGILFIDRINQKNNLWYCETISATNPCGEQPLPPEGACLLGSFNLTKYVVKLETGEIDRELPPNKYYEYGFNYGQFREDIPHVVRAMDNVIDASIYPLQEQEDEAKSKRRMGLGLTGVANAIESLGYPYGSAGFLRVLEKIMTVLRDETYRASIDLAKEKGPFPLYSQSYLRYVIPPQPEISIPELHDFAEGEPIYESKWSGINSFVNTLPADIKQELKDYGIRNSHLLSIAPTGTISLTADNVSSGIEPTFANSYTRKIQTFDGERREEVVDYGVRSFGTVPRVTSEVTVKEHVDVLCLASRFVDSACSKTCNVGDDVSWEEFKDVYRSAYIGGASGCTTFRASGKRFGVLNASAVEDIAEAPEEDQGDSFVNEEGACYFDPDTGLRNCE